MSGHNSRKLNALITFFFAVVLSTTIDDLMGEENAGVAHVSGPAEDMLSDALKKTETKTLINGGLASKIYLNTITVAENEFQNNPLTLVWIVFPHEFVTVRTCPVNKIGPANVLYETYAPRGALAMINGGFYGFQSDSRETPIGLLVRDGDQLFPSKRWQTGGFLVVREKSNIEIIPVAQRSKVGNPREALQSKPLLISNGMLAVKRDSKDQRFNRSAIGLTETGDIVIAAAIRSDTQALTLHDFGKFLALLKSLKGVNIKDALNLDGATDSHLYVASSALHLGYGGSNYVPSALAIIPRPR